MNNSVSDSLIKVNNLGKVVASPEGQLVLLSDINLIIHSGEAVSILGVSGSGKSTLLGLLAGLDTPSTGQVLIRNQDIGALDEDGRAALRKSMIGFVFQSFHLLPNLTALENVMLPMELLGADGANVMARELLTHVGLGPRLYHYPKQLSGGEQQRVAIARAFVTQPELVFADEPTGNLDRATGKRVIDLLFEIKRDNNTTLVIVTHDNAVADRCDRHLTLDEGRLVGS